MISYQFPYTLFDQLSDNTYGISLYGRLFTKLLAQAANKNTKFMFTKTGRLLYSVVFFYSNKFTHT